MIKNFQVSPPPHVRSQKSAAGMTWGFVFALFPAWLTQLIHQPVDGFRIFGFLFAVAFLTEFAASFLTRKKTTFKDGSAALWMLLLSLMVPEHTGFGALFLAVFAALFLGKECYGGRTGVWLHPAWLGAAFLVLSFPQTSLFSFWNPFSGLWPALITLALLSGGIFLTVSKNIFWEIPLLYLTLVFIPCQFMGIHSTLSLPAVLLNAFWILPDPSSAPCSRRGRIYCAIAAALLTLVLDLLSVPAAPVFAVLLLNLLTPWMDEWILPRGLSFEAQPQGAGDFR